MKSVFFAGLLSVCASAGLAASVDFGTNFGAATTHGQTISTFDFGGGLTGSLLVENFGDLNTPGEARIFDTNESGTADPDLEGDFSNSNGSGEVRDFGSALIIQERASLASDIADDERAGGSITFFFDKAIDLLGLTYLDGERGASVFAIMTEVGSVAAGVAGDNEFTDVDLTGNSLTLGITEFRVVYNGSGAIGSLDIQVAAVPLPAAFGFLLAGLGGLGLIRRGKNAA